MSDPLRPHPSFTSARVTKIISPLSNQQFKIDIEGVPSILVREISIKGRSIDIEPIQFKRGFILQGGLEFYTYRVENDVFIIE